MLEHDDPGLVELRKRLPKEQLEKYIEVTQPLDALNYVPRAAPVQLLFQFARFERFFSDAAMNRYFQAASEPKAVLWYDTGHDLNDIQTLLDRATWLQKQIELKAGTVAVRHRSRALTNRGTSLVLRGASHVILPDPSLIPGRTVGR